MQIRLEVNLLEISITYYVSRKSKGKGLDEPLTSVIFVNLEKSMVNQLMTRAIEKKTKFIKDAKKTKESFDFK